MLFSLLLHSKLKSKNAWQRTITPRMKSAYLIGVVNSSIQYNAAPLSPKGSYVEALGNAQGRGFQKLPSPERAACYIALSGLGLPLLLYPLGVAQGYNMRALRAKYIAIISPVRYSRQTKKRFCI